MAKSDFGAALTRRHFIHAAAGGAAALSAAFASGLKAAEAKELRILFPGGTWKDWFENIFVAPYAARSGMKAIWKTGLGWEPLVLAQRNRPQWDLVHESQVTSSQLGSMNAVLEWRESRIPNLSKIHPSFRYPHLAGKVHTPYGIAVNTKRIKKNVNSWWDLWDPAFAGKVAFPAWVWVGEDVFHTVNVLAGGDGENIDPGIAKLKELHKTNKAQMINNVEHTKQLLVSEDVWICPYFGARTEQAKAAGAPVEFVLPKEGGISWIWNTSIIAGRPPESIELAENFVNTTLEAAKQVEFCRLTGYPPTNIEVIRNLPPDLKRLELTEAQLAGFGDLQRKQDPMAQFAYRDRNKERWAKEVLG